MAFADDGERRQFLDGLQEALRAGEPERALSGAKEALFQVASLDPDLANIVRETDVESLRIEGWPQRKDKHFRLSNGSPVAAISIDISWPGHFAQSVSNGVISHDYEKHGGLKPALETSYFADRDDLSFSTADRNTLLKGYRGHRAIWTGEFEDIDYLLEIAGLDRLYGAVQQAYARTKTDPAYEDAYAISAAIAAILVHLAVKRTIAHEGLPQPMAVFVGSNEDFPFFDAPVVSAEEARQFVPVFEARSSAREAEETEARARAEGERAQREAEETRFDPAQGLNDFREAAKIAGDIVDHIRKEKEIFLGLGVVGLAAMAHHFRQKK